MLNCFKIKSYMKSKQNL